MRVTYDIPLGCPLFLTGSHCKFRQNTEGMPNGELGFIAVSTQSGANAKTEPIVKVTAPSAAGTAIMYGARFSTEIYTR
jgi:hypothetical protein